MTSFCLVSSVCAFLQAQGSCLNSKDGDEYSSKEEKALGLALSAAVRAGGANSGRTFRYSDAHRPNVVSIRWHIYVNAHS